MKIKYVEGDLFGPILAMPREKTIFIVHCCNNKKMWGSGFVIPLGYHFPQAKEEYLNWDEKTFRLGETQFVQVKENIVVANMVAQNNVIRNTNGVRPLRYNALSKCMDEVTKHITQEYLVNGKDVEIITCSFGSNLAGGNWDFIAELIKDCWLNEGIPVTIHYLKGTLPEIECHEALS